MKMNKPRSKAGLLLLVLLMTIASLLISMPLLGCTEDISQTCVLCDVTFPQGVINEHTTFCEHCGAQLCVCDFHGYKVCPTHVLCKIAYTTVTDMMANGEFDPTAENAETSGEAPVSSLMSRKMDELKEQLVAEHSPAACGNEKHFICDEMDHTHAACGAEGHYNCDGMNHTVAPCGTQGHTNCDGKDHAPTGCGAEGHYYCEITNPDELSHHSTTADCGDYLCVVYENESQHLALDCGWHYACSIPAAERGQHSTSTCGHCVTVVNAAPDEHQPLGCDNGHFSCMEDVGTNHDLLTCGHYACDEGNHEIAACNTHYSCEDGEHEICESCSQPQCNGSTHFCYMCNQYACAENNTANHTECEGCHLYLCIDNGIVHDLCSSCNKHLCDNTADHSSCQSNSQKASQPTIRSIKVATCVCA